MRLLWSLVWLAFAASANPFMTESVGSGQLEERSSHLVKRSRSKCGPNIDTSSSSEKRSVGYIRFERNVSIPLEKRMELPKRTMGAFYRRELPKMTEAVVPHEEADIATDMSTAVLTSFDDLQLDPHEEYSTGAQHISGCTMLYLISRKGVYATHWWESVSFAPDKIWLKKSLTQPKLFKKTVIDMLTKGGRYHPKLDADAIEDDYIKAYIVRPTTTHAEKEGDEGYTKEWEQVRTTVGKIVPTLQDRSRWRDIKYQALNNKDPALNDLSGTAGKNLFKFDPAHKIGRGQTQHYAALWVEDEKTPYHLDQW
ncbi:hypothetical protein BDV25DRAFT_138782 [Aspergillus avenaceus]|uniref:Uncharacterized protein n=1 Tax=Aspergillus avenaceus TaxID=36643 RepID=A0A5N6TYT5_ASPAV|nr:hypothetical protein BDV25DRAFT_138782 [Aspergillus avenaceus]